MWLLALLLFAPAGPGAGARGAGGASRVASGDAGPGEAAETAARPPAGRLYQLAARAADAKASPQTRRRAWEDLRRYAASTRVAEQRGEAYLVVGYWEDDAGEAEAALADLSRAAKTSFSLAEFAEYLAAHAAMEGHQPAQAVELLEGFETRHPTSPLRLKALAVLAEALIASDRPQRAIQLLTALPRVRREPPLALLLAQAYEKAGRIEDAAHAYQDLYYGLPTSREAEKAEQSLAVLRTRLGANFPKVSEAVKTARAEILFRHRRYQDALSDYESLLRVKPSNDLEWRWEAGRARCLLGLKRAREALTFLDAVRPANPAADADRLEVLVEAHADLADEAAMISALGQLSVAFPKSPAYAAALAAVANYYLRQQNWEAVGRYDQLLAEGFPDSDAGRLAEWRAAWAAYLAGDEAKARAGFADEIRRYPASPHVPGALYWLGRLGEERGETAGARESYRLLSERFTQSYYASEARLRLARLPREKSGRAGLAAAGPEASPLVEAAPRKPPGDLCRVLDPVTPSEVRRQVTTLRALSLVPLAKEYLQAEVARNPASPDARYLLSQVLTSLGDPAGGISSAKELAPDYFNHDFRALPREVWDLLYPRLYWNIVRRQARANGLDPYLVMGLIRQESGFNARATSPADARGLMQMLPQTAVETARTGGRRRRNTRARTRAAAERLYDPAYNIRLACRYLRAVIKTFDGNLGEALAAYNAGDARVKEWLSKRPSSDSAVFVESIPIGETRLYVEAVLRDAVIYRRLLSGEDRFKSCP